MTVEELLVFGKSCIHSDHAKLLLSDLLGFNPLELLNHLHDLVDIDKCEKYKKEVSALKEGKPLQYVIGNVNFYGYSFMVDERVLIPRFETEQLVEEVCKYIESSPKKNLKVLDIGCGSGVIGLTLKKKFPQISVDLLDISKDALEVAKENATQLGVEAKFIESDLFSKVSEKYDIIVSNPPYIRENEKIEQIVKDNEPSIALYGGADGLLYYKRIIKDIKSYLKEDFFIAFEIGCQQAEDIIRIANEYLDNVNITKKQDLSERDRMIFIENRNKK